MGVLTTHVLDTSSGRPGSGIQFDLYRLEDKRRQLMSSVTNADGRCDYPLLEGNAFIPGVYEIVFQAGEYFRQAGLVRSPLPFLEEVIIRFGVDDASEHYHVPLLISPFSYSTYRGS